MRRKGLRGNHEPSGSQVLNPDPESLFLEFITPGFPAILLRIQSNPPYLHTHHHSSHKKKNKRMGSVFIPSDQSQMRKPRAPVCSRNLQQVLIAPGIPFLKKIERADEL